MNKTIEETKDELKHKLLELTKMESESVLISDYKLFSIEFHRLAMEEVFGKPVAYSARTPQFFEVGAHRKWTFEYDGYYYNLTQTVVFHKEESIWITKGKPIDGMLKL